MKTAAEANQLNYQFDRFRVDTSAFRLLNGDTPVNLEPKALQLLLFLIENRGRLIEKQQILDAVWGDASVTENALTREIAILRRALGDDTRQPRFIETVPTRGYRFVAKVQELGSDSQPEPAQITDAVDTSDRFRKRRLIFLAAVAAAVVAVFVVGYGLRKLLERHIVSSRADASKLVQVTFSSGLDVFPSFSPDGNSIAYSSDSTGSFEIYIRPLFAQAKELQITSDGQANVEPAYSPDAQWIAYHSRSRNGIWIVPALGGVARRLTEFGSHPSWSHDGTRIAFTSGDIGAIMETEAGVSPGSSIWVVNVADGALGQLTHASDTPDQGMFGQTSPQWTPDDSRVLFAGSWIIWTVAADGTDLQPVTREVFGYDPVLSADGQKIWFIGGSPAEFGIWEIPVDARMKASGAPRLLHNMPPGTGHHLAVSGNRIAFVQVSTRDNLYSISMGKNGGRNSAPIPITLDTRLRKTNPGISPNGKLVCFGVAQIGRPNQIWIADMENKTAQQIPVGRAAGNPAWLSDNEVMYWTPAHDTAPQLWKWNIAEGRTTKVLDSDQPALAFVRPSPDGHTAAFQRAFQGTMNVWSFSMDDRTIRQLTFNQSPVGWPAWSRDGKRLAVEVKTGGDTNIGLIPASGGPISMITHDSGQDWPYSWSPDDEQIAFAGQRNGRWNVFSVSVKTGAETQLTNYTAANTYVRYPEWSPTGDRIVYEYGESTGNIWMLESR